MRHHSGWLLVVQASLAASPARADRPSVQTLEQAYEACHHWAGEEATDARRQRQINAGLRRDCGAALQAAKRALRSRETPSPAAAGLILRIVAAAGGFGSEAARLARNARQLCDRALPYFQAGEPAEDPDAQAEYRSLCPQQAGKAGRPP
jgi:hypothetical protein